MGSDGSLIFDTDLDTEGFERGSSKLHSAINKLVSSVGKIGNIDPVSKDFRAKIEQTKTTIEDLRAKLVEMGEKTISSKGYEETNAAIVKAEGNLTRLVHRQKELLQSGASRDGAQWERLAAQIQNAEAKLKALNDQKQRMEADGSAFTYGFQTEEYAALKEQLHGAEAALLQYEAAQEQVGKSSWVAGAVGGLKSALKSVGSAAVSTTKKLLLLPLNAVSAGFKKAASGIKEYIKNIGKSHSATSGLLKGLTSLKTMLFSRVKRMFISYIFNEMKEAMNALQQYDKSFGTAMNNMKNAAKGLSANLAVSFGGLISAIEPVLTKIINAISTAISYINALFALLGGKSTVTVAKKQMNDYANAAGGAGKKVEELKRQVYSFDELNRRSKDSDSGGGGGGGNAADLFEEVPIAALLPDSVREFFERIKEAFENNDWEGIGSIIAEGLNTGMGVVDRWITGTLQPMAVLWSERVALVLNGLVKGIDWALMGKTLADGLNTVFKSIDTFLSTFDFAATGRAVANLVKGFFSNIDWASIAHGLSSGVKGVFDGLTAFIQTIDWRAIPRNIVTTLKTMIQNTDWTGIARSFAGYLGSAIGAELANGAGIWDLMKEAGKAIVDGFENGILERIKGIGSWIKTNIYDPFIEGLCSVFGINSLSKVMQEQGGYIVEGLLLGITEGWNKITGFFSTALNTLKTGLENAWNGVKTAAGSAWNAVKTAVTNPFDTTKTTVGSIANSIKAGLSTAWNNVKTTAGTAWNAVKTAATTPFNNMKSTLTTGVSSLKSSLSTGWNNIGTGATQSWSGISSNVTTKWNTLKSTLQNTNWATVGSNICTGIGNGINSGWSWLTSRVSSLASSLLSTAKRALGIHSPSRVFRDEIGENIGLGLAEGIEGTEKQVNRSVAALAKSTADGFGNQNLSFDVSGSEMISGLDRVADKLSAIADTFRAITSMLDNVGSLNVPQIAAGTVVPPKVRAGSYSGVDPDSGFASFAGDFDGFVSDFLRYNERIIELLEALNRKRLTVDALSVQRELTTYQRNFGGV